MGLKSYTGKFWRHHWLTRPHGWSKSMRENQHILPRVYPQTRCRKVPLVFERDCDYMNTHSCLYSVPNSEFEILQSPNHFTVIADSSHSVHNPQERTVVHRHTHTPSVFLLHVVPFCFHRQKITTWQFKRALTWWYKPQDKTLFFQVSLFFCDKNILVVVSCCIYHYMNLYHRIIWYGWFITPITMFYDTYTITHRIHGAGIC